MKRYPISCSDSGDLLPETLVVCSVIIMFKCALRIKNCVAKRAKGNDKVKSSFIIIL